MLSLSFTPLVPLWLLGLLGIVVLLAAVVAVLARGPVAILRAVALVIVLAALANPSLVQQEREPVRSVVALVTDRSASQSLGDRATMTAQVRAEMEKRIGALAGIDLRLVEAGEGDGEDGTRLFTALGRALADVPPDRLAGVVTITDGVVHDIPADLSALGFNAPLHALVTGRPNERDRRIALLEAPRFGIVGKDQTIRAEVSERGGTGVARITVRRDGQPVQSRDVRTGAPFSVTVRVEHGGPNVVEIEVDDLPGELTRANNRAVVTMEGIREKLRVLLVSGEPHPGERTWRNLLKSDANVDLVHFTILRPPEKQDGTPISELSLIAFPTRELFQQKIKDFDLIIFDRYANQSVLPATYFDNIARYVREGGALLLAAGPEFASTASLARTRLASILPAMPDGSILEEKFRPRITRDGERHPVARDLPGSESEPPAWGGWLRTIGADVRRGASVMAGAADKPLLVLARENKGRVALLLSDHAWLWARGYEDGGPHVDLLRRLAHWLMKEPALEEEALRAEARGREITVERQTVGPDPGPVTVVSPGGASTTVSTSEARPGLFRGSLRTSELGLYTLRSGDLVAFASIGPANPLELADVFSDTERLAPVADATGGSVRRVAAETGPPAMPRVQLVQSGRRFAGTDWIGFRPSEAFVVRGVSVLPLGLGLLGLAGLLGAVLLAWVIEGRRRAA